MTPLSAIRLWCVDHFILCILFSFLCGFLCSVYSFRSRLDDTTDVIVTDTCDDTSHSPTENLVTVELAGAVKKPGVYTLPENSRAVDLIRKGEGFLSDASAFWVAKSLNLSEKLHDMDKLYVPFEWDLQALNLCEKLGSFPSSIRSGEFQSRIESQLVSGHVSNTLSGESLSQVAGGGLVSGLVHDSDAYSSKSSSNASTSSGLRVSHTSDFEDASPVVGESSGQKVDVNTASAEELDSLPGIGPAYAKKIVSARPYADFEELVSNSKVPVSSLNKIKELITF